MGIGTEVSFEVVQAAAPLKNRVPELRMYVVNITDMMILGVESFHPHALSDDSFDAPFSPDWRTYFFNYHGYETELKGLLFGRPSLNRVTINSYREEGSTTTPFDMMLVNHVSRFHVAKAAVQGGSLHNEKVRVKQQELLTGLDHDISAARKYILANKTGEHDHTFFDSYELSLIFPTNFSVLDPDDMYDMPKFD